MLNLLSSTLNNGMIADIACLLIIAIFAISNLTKGFFKQVLKVACGIIALFLAYFFCDKLLSFVDEKLDLTAKLATKILGVFGENEALAQQVSAENVATAITAMGLPQFVADFAVSAISDVIMGMYANIGEYLSNVLSHYILLALSYIAIYLVAKIVLLIVRKIIENIVKLPVIRSIDKLLGLLFGLVKAVILLYVVIFLIDVLPFNGLIPVRTALSNSMIGAFLQEHNLFANLIGWIITKFNI